MVSITEVAADGLTKALSPQKYGRFVTQLDLIDIAKLLQPIWLEAGGVYQLERPFAGEPNPNSVANRRPGLRLCLETGNFTNLALNRVAIR
jgi:hypothetical protein